MGLYSEQILPRLTDRVMRDPEFDMIRARVAAGLNGEVLEVGFGSGLNVPHYPATVTSVIAVDPATMGRRAAAKRVATRRLPVDYVGLDAQALAVDSASVDHVLMTWTLCTIPDPDRALAEIYRVLRPGGTLRFVEHGRSPDLTVSRWQNRLTPLQRRVAGGCHLNRPIAELIERSGLEVTKLNNYYVKGPKAFGYMFEGIAEKS